VGLLYITVELWAYKKAVLHLKLRFVEANRKAKLPRSMMTFWLIVLQSFTAIHFASVSSADPGLFTLTAVVAPLILAWATVFYCAKRRSQQADVPADAVELVDTRNQF